MLFSYKIIFSDEALHWMNWGSKQNCKISGEGYIQIICQDVFYRILEKWTQIIGVLISVEQRVAEHVKTFSYYALAFHLMVTYTH